MLDSLRSEQSLRSWFRKSLAPRGNNIRIEYVECSFSCPSVVSAQDLACLCLGLSCLLVSVGLE